MKDSSKKLLEKAKRAIAAAERNLKVGDTEVAAGRAYYAMFYVAEALLNEKGLNFRKHGGVHGAFGEHFAKTGVLDSKYHRWMIEAFDQRLAADYGVDSPLSTEDADLMIKQAKEFFEAVQKRFS